VAETVILYDRATGVTVDELAMKAELEALGLAIRLSRNSEAPPSLHSDVPTQRLVNPDNDPCRAEAFRQAGGREITIDAEEFPAHEQMAGLARLLRRVLPEPAKVIASMVPEQFDAYQGRKQEAQ
jgi:hypothetical protein